MREGYLSYTEICEKFAGQTVLLHKPHFDGKKLVRARVVGRCVGTQAKEQLLLECERKGVGQRLLPYQVPEKRMSIIRFLEPESHSEFARNERVVTYLYRQRNHPAIFVLIILGVLTLATSIHFLFADQLLLSLAGFIAFGTMVTLLETVLRRTIEVTLRFFPQNGKMEYRFWSPLRKRKFVVPAHSLIKAFARFNDDATLQDIGLEFRKHGAALLIPFDTASKRADFYRLVRFLKRLSMYLHPATSAEIRGFLVAYLAKSNMSLEPEVFFPNPVPLGQQRGIERKVKSSKKKGLRKPSSIIASSAALADFADLLPN